jgi:6-phosphofructo-2-kinase/fructose-2,6-biphosphatase 4
MGCEKLIWDFFESGGQVVIYDANNGTRSRRQALAEKFDKGGIHVVMLGAFTTSCPDVKNLSHFVEL